MNKDNTVFLKHMLDAINLIKSYLKDKSYEEFKSNRMLQDAVIRRDKLIHGYFGVDLDAVWDTATKDIPLLREKLQEILKEEKK